MAIFNSYVKLPEGKEVSKPNWNGHWNSNQIPAVFSKSPHVKTKRTTQQSQQVQILASVPWPNGIDVDRPGRLTLW